MHYGVKKKDFSILERFNETYCMQAKKLREIIL